MMQVIRMGFAMERFLFFEGTLRGSRDLERVRDCFRTAAGECEVVDELVRVFVEGLELDSVLDAILGVDWFEVD